LLPIIDQPALSQSGTKNSKSRTTFSQLYVTPALTLISSNIWQPSTNVKTASLNKLTGIRTAATLSVNFHADHPQMVNGHSGRALPIKHQKFHSCLTYNETQDTFSHAYNTIPHGPQSWRRTTSAPQAPLRILYWALTRPCGDTSYYTLAHIPQQYHTRIRSQQNIGWDEVIKMRWSLNVPRVSRSSSPTAEEEKQQKYYHTYGEL
jgi:hypothetical protein